MVRDFTYIADIVEGVVRVIDNPPAAKPHWDAVHPDPSTSSAPYKVYNIGNNNPVRLMDFVEAIENTLGKKAEKQLMPMQAGDVAATCADVQDLVADLHYKPETRVVDGIQQFIAWYRKYYNV